MLTGKEILCIQKALIIRAFLRQRDITGVAGWCHKTHDAYSRYMQVTHGIVPRESPFSIKEVPNSIFEGVDLSDVVDPSELVKSDSSAKTLPDRIAKPSLTLTPRETTKNLAKKSLRPAPIPGKKIEHKSKTKVRNVAKVEERTKVKVKSKVSIKTKMKVKQNKGMDVGSSLSLSRAPSLDDTGIKVIKIG